MGGMHEICLLVSCTVFRVEQCSKTDLSREIPSKDSQRADTTMSICANHWQANVPCLATMPCSDSTGSCHDCSRPPPLIHEQKQRTLFSNSKESSSCGDCVTMMRQSVFNSQLEGKTQSRNTLLQVWLFNHWQSATAASMHRLVACWLKVKTSE
jgi:hypothetical protein